MPMPARNQRYLVPVAASDDDFVRVGNPDGLSAKQEAFCVHYAEHGNQAAAYRQAYTVDNEMMPQVIWASASRLASLPHIKVRLQELQQQKALEMIVSVREALMWRLDIATADPNEVAYVAKRACRYCYGVDFKFQWTDDDEYMQACMKAISDGDRPPDDVGGYGYSRAHEPVATCPHCLGDGNPESVINDTRKLTGKARKLYKGIDYKNGSLVVLLHDQAKAWDDVCRMLGAFKDNLSILTPPGSQKIPEGLSEQDTARAYLKMLS